MKLFGLFEVEVLRIAFQLNEDRNAQTDYVLDFLGFDCFRSLLAGIGSGRLTGTVRSSPFCLMA